MLIQVSENDIKRFAYDAFKAVDVEDTIAELTAYAVWLTSLRGVDSHGIRLLPHYIKGVIGGRLNPYPNIQFNQTAVATGILDADHTIGHAASILAMRHAVKLAREAGIGMVLAKNSSHNGAMATYGLEAAQHDMIGITTTNATPKTRTPNGTRPFFGTNPICISAPMLNEAPFCFDAAPTPFSANKVQQYHEDGKVLPDGVAADIKGQPTDNAGLAFQMLPIGDYKGFGITMMADILSSMLTGMPSGNQVSEMGGNSMAEKRYLAHFFMAIRIDAFRDIEEFKQDLQTNADAIRKEPRLDESMHVMVPGDPEKVATQHRKQHGIPVKDLDIQKLADLAQQLKITPLQPL